MKQSNQIFFLSSTICYVYEAKQVVTFLANTAVVVLALYKTKMLNRWGIEKIMGMLYVNDQIIFHKFIT